MENRNTVPFTRSISSFWGSDEEITMNGFWGFSEFKKISDFLIKKKWIFLRVYQLRITPCQRISFLFSTYITNPVQHHKYIWYLRWGSRVYAGIWKFKKKKKKKEKKRKRTCTSKDSFFLWSHFLLKHLHFYGLLYNWQDTPFPAIASLAQWALHCCILRCQPEGKSITLQ